MTSVAFRSRRAARPFNTLDNTTELFVVEEDGTRTRIDLPIDSAKVKEKRGEAFVMSAASSIPRCA